MTRSVIEFFYFIVEVVAMLVHDINGCVFIECEGFVIGAVICGGGDGVESMFEFRVFDRAFFAD